MIVHSFQSPSFSFLRILSWKFVVGFYVARRARRSAFVSLFVCVFHMEFSQLLSQISSLEASQRFSFFLSFFLRSLNQISGKTKLESPRKTPNIIKFALNLKMVKMKF